MKRIMSLLLSSAMLLNFALPAYANTSGSYDRVATHCSQRTIEKYGEPTLDSFLGDVIDVYQPQAVNLVLDTFPVFAEAAATGGFSDEIGLYINIWYNERDNIPFHCQCGFETAASWYEEKDGGSGMALSLTSAAFLERNGSEYVLTNVGAENLVSTLTHEMMHFCMFEYDPVGMNGISDPSQHFYIECKPVMDHIAEEILFPMWFQEGMASTCGNTYVGWIGEFNGMRTTEEKAAGTYTEENVLSKTVTLKDEDDEVFTYYILGYLESMYLGELAYRRSTGGTSEYDAGGQAAFSSAKIAQGLNILLSRLHNGESLSAIIADISDFSDCDDFDRGFITGADGNGHADSLAFVTKLLNYFDDITNGASNDNNTSLLAEFGVPFSSLYTHTETTAPCFAIAPTSDLVPCTADIPTPYTDGGKGDCRPSDEAYSQILDSFDWTAGGPTAAVYTLTFANSTATIVYVIEKIRDRPDFTTIMINTTFQNPHVKAVAYEMGLYGNYPVHFVNDRGDAPEDQTVSAGEHIQEPEAPTAEGCTFIGWYTDDGELWDFENGEVRAEITLYAKWAANQYTITFDTDGGSAAAPITQDFGTKVIAPVSPVRDGFAFIGWDTAIPDTMPAYDMTIRALWAEVSGTAGMRIPSGTARIPSGTAEPAVTAGTTDDTEPVMWAVLSDDNSITVGWDKIKNADSYILFCEKDGKAVKLAETASTEITLKNAKNASTYKFSLKYTRSGSTYSAPKDYKAAISVYFKPAVKAAYKNGRITLTWAEVPGAQSYKVYRYSDGKLKAVGETAKNAVRISASRSKSGTYSYAVKALVNGRWTTVKPSDIAIAC